MIMIKTNWDFKQTISWEGLWEDVGLMEVLAFYLITRTLQEEFYIIIKLYGPDFPFL